MKIADIHAHIFPEKLAEKASHSIGSFYGVSIEREADMPRLCAEDKLAGITRCVVSNSATNASQVQNANTFLAEAVRGHDGYLAFGTIYPGMDGFEEELDRMLELGLRGSRSTRIFRSSPSTTNAASKPIRPSPGVIFRCCSIWATTGMIFPRPNG